MAKTPHVASFLRVDWQGHIWLGKHWLNHQLGWLLLKSTKHIQHLSSPASS